jgi:hypothetical protein
MTPPPLWLKALDVFKVGSLWPVTELTNAPGRGTLLLYNPDNPGGSVDGFNPGFWELCRYNCPIPEF